MRYRLTSMLTVAALALIGMSGCENAVRPVGPEPVAPELASASTSLESADGSVWQLIEGLEEMGGTHAIIGAAGGELTLGQQTLIVPAGAVDAPTLFTMKKSGSKLRVSLTASRVTANDVGSAGFAKPLDLIFSYGAVASLPGDPGDLVIVWIRPDGVYEPQPTTVNTLDRTVTGEIIHFSEYALATN